MSNYLQLIQNLSRIKLGKAPVDFSAVSNKRYDRIKDALINSLEEFILLSQHNFRSKKQSFNTIVNFNKYQHVYGIIKNLTINKSELYFEPDPDELILNTTATSVPVKYTIFDDKIVLYPIPDAVYNITVICNTDKLVKEVHLLDASSSAGQDKVYLASTVGLVIGDIIVIDPFSSLEETGIISSITEGDYVTLTTNLVNTHNVNSTVEKYKYTFEYETDEPNFPSRYHKVLEYHSLRQLYFSNPPKLSKYNELYSSFIRDIEIENRGSIGNKPKFTFS